ncbi:MAG: CxxC-x17-CxxC domain-containing protein [Candidatus Paceibacterota bacterium]|jgi:CxxC-x17-CxxC domain-containing protein
MKKFDKMFRGGGGNRSRERDFEGRDRGERRFGGGDRERPQMHEAVCSDCGKRCEVPFRPSGDRPVYCAQCFTNHKEGETSDRPMRRDSDRPMRRDHDRPRFQDRKMFEATCAKCGARFELPFRPIGDKPVYCKECFSKTSGYSSSEKPADQYKKQFDVLNEKLDRIINALAVPAEGKEENRKEEAPMLEMKEKTGSPEKAAKKPKKAGAKKPADKKKKTKK